MAYQHSQVARECSAITTPSARLVFVILASAMDKDDDTCFYRYETLMHYCKLSQPTLSKALREIEETGIITRKNRYRQSNIYQWHRAVAESFRDPIRKHEPATEDVPPAESILADEYTEDDLIQLAERFNSSMGFKPDMTDFRCNSEKIVALMDGKRVGFRKLEIVVDCVIEASKERMLHKFIPNSDPSKQRLSWRTVVHDWDHLVTMQERIEAEGVESVSGGFRTNPFQLDEDI